MIKATALAPANIAFIKYWGKVDPEMRVPNNNSISMNLSQMYTVTTVEFSQNLKQDKITFLDEKTVKEKETKRVVLALDKIRKTAKIKLFAKVVTQNTFPKATGIASSASGFASLAVAAFGALGVFMPEKELSMFCRTLSGTASRSIPNGFVEWVKGTGPDTSYAYSLYPSEYWDICDVIAIVSKTMKKVGSTEGHAIADTSPFYEARMRGLDKKVQSIKETMRTKNFSAFGRIVEDEALNMHAICLTSQPPLIYWEPQTIAIMKHIVDWREKGIVESYFTIDAGPTVHVICEGRNAPKVVRLLEKIPGIQQIIANKPARGAHLITEHLF